MGSLPLPLAKGRLLAALRRDLGRRHSHAEGRHLGLFCSHRDNSACGGSSCRPPAQRPGLSPLLSRSGGSLASWNKGLQCCLPGRSLLEMSREWGGVAQMPGTFPPHPT